MTGYQDKFETMNNLSVTLVINGRYNMRISTNFNILKTSMFDEIGVKTLLKVSKKTKSFIYSKEKKYGRRELGEIDDEIVDKEEVYVTDSSGSIMVEKQTKDIAHCILGVKIYQDDGDFKNESIEKDKENI